MELGIRWTGLHGGKITLASACAVDGGRGEWRLLQFSGPGIVTPEIKYRKRSREADRYKGRQRAIITRNWLTGWFYNMESEILEESQVSGKMVEPLTRGTEKKQVLEGNDKWTIW